MNLDYITKNDIVDRYRRHELSPEEAAEFEAYYMDKPEIIEQLELDHWLAAGVKSAMLQSAPVQRPVWQLPLAASVLLMFGASLVYNVQLATENRAIEAELEAYAMATANVDVLTLAPQRSVENDFRPAATMRQNPDARFVLIGVQLYRPGSDTYEVSISSFGIAEKILVVAEVQPRGAGDLLISVPSSILTPGDYILTAQGDGSDATEIQFRVVGGAE